MVLPVPLITIERIKTIIGNFVWDEGFEKRRHWASWETLSKPKDCGGLGIRDPSLLQTVLHGKLAWKFICQNSLWAAFAKDRFREGDKGSAMWSSFHHLIEVIRENGSWVIGRGDSSLEDIGWKCGLTFDVDWKHLSIRAVMDNPDRKSAFLAMLPPRLTSSFERICFNNSEDRFIWTKDETGIFSTSSFWNFCSTQHAKVELGRHIWKVFIPPKVSMLIWKLYHNVVPTDDVISRLHISLASKCWCCKIAQVETSRHLFFTGEKALGVWEFVSKIFNKPKVRSFRAFTRSWLHRDSKDYIDRFALSIACIALWELWKARNVFIHEGTRTCVIRKLIDWGPKVAIITKGQYKSSFRSALSLKVFSVLEPMDNVCRHIPIKWKPHMHGLTLNIAIHHNSYNLVSGIIRDPDGIWYWGSVLSLDIDMSFTGFIKALTLMESRAKEIQCSHFHMLSLVTKEQNLPTNLVQDVRRCRNALSHVKFSNIMPLLNNSAIALAFNGSIGEYLDHSTLPKSVRRALIGDQLYCPVRSPFAQNDRSRDDISLYYHDDADFSSA